MAKSIIQEDKTHCFICGRNANADYWGLDEHHCFAGARRKLSEHYGLKIYICHNTCHLEGVHKKAELDNMVKSIVQQRAMQYYEWSEDDFRRIFGKSYL